MTSLRKKLGSLVVIAAVTTAATVAIADGYAAVKPLTSPVHKTDTSGRTGGESKLGDGQSFIYQTRRQPSRRSAPAFRPHPYPKQLTPLAARRNEPHAGGSGCSSVFRELG